MSPGALVGAEAPTTPYLQIDLPRLRRNLDAAASRAARAGVALRPHAKTHKCLEIAHLQLAAGAVGLTVATIGEAEAFVRGGCPDVFIAYPLWLDERSARRVADLAESARVAIGVDSVRGAANAAHLLGGTGVDVLVEVDCGHRRTGASPADAATVALAATRGGLPVRGVFSFPGHSYGPDPAGAARDESAALGAAADRLRSAGVPVEVVSGGLTPSLDSSDHDVLTEVRPGVYAFGDAQQWELGTMPPEHVALLCRATVVSHAGGRLVLDAGSKALGADRAAYATGYGRLPRHPDARVVMLSEHHAVVDLGDEPLPALGEVVEVVPNHVCAAVNLADALWVEDGGALRCWPVTARGRNG